MSEIINYIDDNKCGNCKYWIPGTDRCVHYTGAVKPTDTCPLEKDFKYVFVKKTLMEIREESDFYGKS